MLIYLFVYLLDGLIIVLGRCVFGRDEEEYNRGIVGLVRGVVSICGLCNFLGIF